MNTNPLTQLQARITEAQAVGSQGRGYPEPLIFDIVQFIDQSEKQSFAAWGRLLKISGGTLGSWFRHYQESHANEPGAIPTKQITNFESAFVEISQSAHNSTPAHSQELIVLNIGSQTQVQLRIDQLALLLGSLNQGQNHA
jgi:hypothetical protein